MEEIIKNHLLMSCKKGIIEGFSSLDDDMKNREFKEVFYEKERYESKLDHLKEVLEEKIKNVDDININFDGTKEDVNNFKMKNHDMLIYQEILDLIKDEENVNE